MEVDAVPHELYYASVKARATNCGRTDFSLHKDVTSIFRVEHRKSRGHVMRAEALSVL